MASLKLYYSSGSGASRAFTGEARKSIGGCDTGVALPNGGLNNLFGDISLRMLSNRLTDYRGVFIRNKHATLGLTGLEMYADVPLVAGTTDPSTLTPVSGDKYVVPTGSIGAWLDKDGKQATWDGSAWVFTLAPMTTYQFGFSVAGNTTIIESDDDVTITNGYVRPLENIFEAPLGIDFYSADSAANALTIGDGTIAAGVALFMWIKRTVSSAVNEDDLVVDGGPLITTEEIPIVFNYDI